MQNYGSTKTYIMQNGKKHLNKINWNINYDGDHVLGKVYVKNDNHRKQYDISLNNNDIAQLFNINAVNKPIDNRLQDDFFQNYSRMDEDDEDEREEQKEKFLPIHLTPMPTSPNYDMNEFIEPMTPMQPMMSMRPMRPMSKMGYRRNPTLRRRIQFRIVPMNNRSKRRLPLRLRTQKPVRVTPYPMKTRKRPLINRRSFTSINK